MNHEHEDHAGAPAEQSMPADSAEPAAASAPTPMDAAHPDPPYPPVAPLDDPATPPEQAEVLTDQPVAHTAQPPEPYDSGGNVVPIPAPAPVDEPADVMAEQAAPQPEQPPAYEAMPQPEQPPAYEAMPQPEQSPAYEAAPQPEQPPAYEAVPQPEQPPAYEAMPQPEQPPAYETSPQPASPAPAHQPSFDSAGQVPYQAGQPQPAVPASPEHQPAPPAAAEQPVSFAPTPMMGADRDPIDLIKDAVTAAFNAGSSDVHIHAGLVPYARLSGQLQAIPGQQTIEEDALMEALRSITSHTPDKLNEYRETGEADLSWAIPGMARFRVNIFRERGNSSVVLRVIPNDVPQLADIGVPPVVRQLAETKHGLILVTGATGSGKSTTLGAMIDHINRTTAKHILTIEDPIEILHSNQQSVISQREVGIDTPSFGQALRRALRQDPDVILVGEIRDEETMQTALSAAETGHLVLSTLHTNSAAESIGRILDLFPPSHERQARAMLAESLVGIISQRLVKTVSGGRVPAVEVMVQTGRTMRCIHDPDETGNLEDVIKDGGFYGMQSFDQALLELLMQQQITVDEAVFNANQPQNFRLMMEAAGLGPDGQMTPQALSARAADLQERQSMADAEGQADELSQELANIHAQMEAQGMRVPGSAPEAPGAGGAIPPPGAPQAPPGANIDPGAAPPSAA